MANFVSLKSGVTLQNAPAFMKCGGGPSVAAGIARLGTRSAFIGTVGDGCVERFLANELKSLGVDTRGITFDRDFKTRVAFGSLTSDGARDFEFWEQQLADQELHFDRINGKVLLGSDVVNIGSFLLLWNPSRNSAIRVAREARTVGKEACFDPNLRLSLWKGTQEARRVLTAMVRCVTIVRLNGEEAIFLTHVRNVEKAAAKIRSYSPQVVVVTLADRDCYFQSTMASGRVPGFRARSVDTTSCGDGFLAGLLHGLVRTETTQDGYSTDALQSICEFANAVGALVVTKGGAIAARPTQGEVVQFLAEKKGLD